jgi:hypothetical protein
MRVEDSRVYRRRRLTRREVTCLPAARRGAETAEIERALSNGSNVLKFPFVVRSFVRSFDPS